jgi:hypothetical protein
VTWAATQRIRRLRGSAGVAVAAFARDARFESASKLVALHKLRQPAHRRSDDTVSLFVINKSPNAALQAGFSIAGFRPESGAIIYSYGIPQDEAARSGTGSPDIATAAFSGAATEFTREFPPYSTTVIVLSPQEHHR